MEYSLVTSPTKDQVKPFSQLRDISDTGEFIAESERVIIRLLESRLEVIALYMTPEQLGSKLPLINAHTQQLPCTILLGSREEMEAVTGFRLHQRIMAIAKIPARRTLQDVLADVAQPHLLVVLDEISDAENMGAIIRTAYGMGATALIYDGSSISPWIRRAVRVSMGAVFKLPIIATDSIAGLTPEMHSLGIQTVAAILSPDAGPIWNLDLKKDTALIFGSEAKGIRHEIIQAAHHKAIIPMQDASLNVGVAQAMCLYEVRRQRSTTITH